MKLVNSLPLLMCLIILKHYGSADEMKSKPILIDGIQWGTMGTYMATSGYIWHLEEDARLPGNILFSSDNALMTTDGKTTHLVAGSVIGYGEGELAQAKFYTISGFLQTSSSHVIVVDRNNNCLRNINRITNLTSQFVGNCTSHGFSDGLYRNARFNAPWFVISNPKDPNEAFVTDMGNHAIRSIDISKGYVRTLIKGLSNPTYAAFDADKENIFVSSIDKLWEVNMKTLAFTLLPLANGGGMDRDFSKAPLGYARGILCMNKVCLVADSGSGNDRLWIFDVEKQKVYLICAGTKTSINGSTTNCSVRYPTSFLLKSDTLYIGEYQSIRNISLKGFLPCEDINLHLSGGEERKCIEVTPGHEICLTPGIFMYNIQEKNCTVKISITKERDPFEKLPCLNSGMCEAGENKTYTNTCRDGWTGGNHQTKIDACTVNPCRNSGTCSIVNGTFICSCVTGWHGVICERELKNLTCPQNISYVADLLTMNVNVSLWSGDRMVYGVGKHIYEKQMADGSLCTTHVEIIDPRLNWKLDVNANYKISCNVLKNFKDLVLTIAKSRHNQMNMISSGYCNRSAVYHVQLSCINNVLSILWPADCQIPYKEPNSHKFMQDIKDFLKRNVGSILDLLVPNHQPPIIYPSLDSDGFPASVVLTPVCPDGTNYHNTTYMCQ